MTKHSIVGLGCYKVVVTYKNNEKLDVNIAGNENAYNLVKILETKKNVDNIAIWRCVDVFIKEGE